MKLISQIHKWTGLIIGVFVFLSCLTGALILIGKLAGSYAPFFRWMIHLHRSLFLGRGGSIILGISTLLLILEIITGYYLWIRIARARIKVAALHGRSRLRELAKCLSLTSPDALHGLHNAGGVWAGIPLGLMALTALTWSFGWYSRLVDTLFDSPTLFHTIAALHTGSFLGLTSRLLWLAASIIGTTLPLTGLLIVLRRRR